MILKKTFFNAAVKTQFKYCPLVWMFFSRTSNNMVNEVHERAYGVYLGGDLSDFESLLQNNKDIYNHHKNIEGLLIEMFKFKNEWDPQIMDFMFERKNESYKLRNFQEFFDRKKKNCALWSWDTKLSVSTIMLFSTRKHWRIWVTRNF